MSRLNNEGVRKAAGGILANLTEAENLKVNKVVLTNGKEAIRTDVLTESVKPAQPEGAEQPIKEELEEPVEGVESKKKNLKLAIIFLLNAVMMAAVAEALKYMKLLIQQQNQSKLKKFAKE